VRVKSASLSFSARYLRALYELGGKLLIVTGLPGGGKTKTVMNLLSHMFSKTKVVYAAPIRRLRNWVAELFGGEVLTSKVEVCHKMKSCSSAYDYLKFILENCPSCGAGCVSEMVKLLHGGRGLMCTTHQMLYIASLHSPSAFRNSVVVIDEAECWLDLFTVFAREEEFAKLKALATGKMRALLRRLERSLIKTWGGLLLFKPVAPASRLLILISATLPEDLMFLFPLTEDSEEGGYSIHRVVLESEMHDEFFVNYGVLKWDDWSWRAKLLDLALKLYDEGKSVGIASRNYELTKYLTSELSSRGVQVYSDVLGKRPPFNLEGRITGIWTTRGKWYRGISLPDTDAIIATYQSPLEKTQSALIDVAFDNGIPFFKLMNDCVNVQSYFRSNRMRSRRHEVYLADIRSWHAMRSVLSHFSKTRWFEKIRKPTPFSL